VPWLLHGCSRGGALTTLRAAAGRATFTDLAIPAGPAGELTLLFHLEADAAAARQRFALRFGEAAPAPPRGFLAAGGAGAWPAAALRFRFDGADVEDQEC
jgi:hypothetical protein